MYSACPTGGRTASEPTVGSDTSANTFSGQNFTAEFDSGRGHRHLAHPLATGDGHL